MLVFLVFCCRFAVAQSAFEPLRVTHDKPFYLTGETVYFTVWFTGNVAPVSEIVHFEIVNAAGKIIDRQKIKRENGTAAAGYFLPVEMTAGNYAFRFYTLQNLNFSGQNYTETVLPIYSSLTPPELIAEVGANGKKENAEVRKTIFTAPNRIFKRSEKVDLQLDFGTDKTVDYSVTVLDENWLPADYSTFEKQEKKAEDKEAGETIYAPEKELTYRLHLKNSEDGTPFNSDYILISRPDRKIFQKAAAIDGTVEFSLPVFTGQNEIQVHNLNPYLPFLPEVSEVFPVFPPATLPALPPADSVISAYFHKTQKVRKLRELYATALPDTQDTATPTVENLPIPFKTYRIADYEGLKNLEEFIENIIVTARLKGKPGEKTVRLFDEDKNHRYLNAPVYFINGYLSGNESEILQIPLSQIETVEIFTTRKSITSGFPQFMLGMGVISVTTRTDEVPRSITNTFNILQVKGVSATADALGFAAPIDESVPLFRPIIYHNGNKRSDENGRASVEFYPTSAVGRYVVRVDYLDENGSLWREEKVIEVQR